MRLQGVYVCIWGGWGEGGLISDEPWWESAGACTPKEEEERRKRRKGGEAALLWMISVSRAAGYGKFTQTNDSHLPEARDTIVGGGWCLGVGVRVGGFNEGARGGPKCRSRNFRSLHLHEGNCSPFLPLWCSHRSCSDTEEIRSPEHLWNLANNRKNALRNHPNVIHTPRPTPHILTPPPPVVSNHAKRPNLLHYGAWHQSSVWLEMILWKYLHSAGWKLMLSMTLCLLITWG